MPDNELSNSFHKFLRNQLPPGGNQVNWSAEILQRFQLPLADIIHLCEARSKVTQTAGLSRTLMPDLSFICSHPSASPNPSPCSQDTLRDCDEESTCYNTVISPIYFVSFVLTAQFVLVNVVIAVLMKHLEESNKEAKEEAELELELELEMKTITPGQHPPSDTFTWTGNNTGERPENPGGYANPMQIKVDSPLSLVHPMVRISGGG